MKELLSSTIPADVGQALLIGCALLMVGLLGVIAGTATERGRTRRDLQDVFTDPDTAKAIFVARWAASAPNYWAASGPEYMAAYVDELWAENDDFQQESQAVARAVHDLVTDELGL